MAALVERFRAAPMVERQPATQNRWGLTEYLKLVSSFAYNGQMYQTGSAGLDQPLEQLVNRVQSQSNVIAAAVATRGLLVQQIKFAWRNIQRGDARYGQLFGNQQLGMLEDPWPGVMTRTQMLALAEYWVSYNGNAYFWIRPDGMLEPCPPDLVDVLLVDRDANESAPGRASSSVAGYAFWREGRGAPQTLIEANEMIHWMPEPHPVYWWRGQSWVTSVLPEVVVDKAAADYLRAHLENAATPAMVIRPHESLSADQVDEYAEVFERAYAGPGNAGKTMWLGAGSDIDVIGSKVADLDLRNLTGGAETRIAVRSRIPAAVLGIREALGGSAMQTGNYNSARRLLADGWFWPTANSLCLAISNTKAMKPPAGAELSFDPAEALFLQEDALDQAEILARQAQAIRQLIDGGYEPDAAVAAIRDNNLSALVGGHSGLTSVQLLPPGAGE